MYVITYESPDVNGEYKIVSWSLDNEFSEEKYAHVENVVFLAEFKTALSYGPKDMVEYYLNVDLVTVTYKIVPLPLSADEKIEILQTENTKLN